MEIERTLVTNYINMIDSALFGLQVLGLIDADVRSRFYNELKDAERQKEW